MIIAKFFSDNMSTISPAGVKAGRGLRRRSFCPHHHPMSSNPCLILQTVIPSLQNRGLPSWLPQWMPLDLFLLLFPGEGKG